MRYPKELLHHPSDGDAEYFIDNGNQHEWTYNERKVTRCSFLKMPRRHVPNAPMFSDVKAGTIFENIRHGYVMFWEARATESVA